MNQKRLNVRIAVSVSWLCLSVITLTQMVYSIATSSIPLSLPGHIPPASPETLLFWKSIIRGTVSLLLQFLLSIAFFFKADKYVYPLFLALLVDRLYYVTSNVSNLMYPAPDANHRLFLLEAVLLLVFAFRFQDGERPFASIWWLPASVTLCRTMVLIASSMSESGKGFFLVAALHYEYLLTAIAFAVTGYYLQTPISLTDKR